MIKVWILVLGLSGAGVFNNVPPMADQTSCEKARAAIDNFYMKKFSSCVEVNIPAPSTDARVLAPK